jgi:hypothetical protein
MLKKDNRDNHDKRYGVKWGSADDHYESDMQGINTLADAIKNMGALTSLDISSNMLVGQKRSGRYKSESVRVGYDDWEDHNVEIMEPDYRGIEALAHGISGNGAMMSLNLASTNLGIEGAKIIADILPKCT